MLQVNVQSRLGDFVLDAAFEAPAQGVTVLFGASGAGKSSVLAAVAGAKGPDAGRIAFGGEAWFDAAAGINLPMERRRIGWVFQDARLFPHLSVEANLRFGLKRAPAGPIRFDALVEVLGIGALLARRPRDLSGGERQRVGLGRALLSQPRLLLMDEPLAALDAPRRAEILPFVEHVKGRFGVPILYVTHSLAEALRLGDRMVVMKDGKVAAQGPVAQIASRPDLMLTPSRAQAGAVLEGQVAGQDGRLTVVRIGRWDIRTPRQDLMLGSPLRLFVQAADVMLALDRPGRISARNVLEGEIAAVTVDGGRAMVSVAHAGQTLLCDLTMDAVEDLALAPGLKVWAVVKSVAIEGSLDALDS
jgi:molybdate transport system ATP-binding protein